MHGYGHTTRAIPGPAALAEVSITANGDGGFDVRVGNVSREGGVMQTPFAPVFWAVHDDSWRIFELDASASAGLEMQAEDGSPMGLVGEAEGADGVLAAGAMAMSEAGEGPGPIGPGGAYAFSVAADAEHPYLSISWMVVNSNDAFISTINPIRLLDDAGSPRPDAMIAADVARMLAVFDAGTEANQVPGFGPDQAPNQAGPNTGAADENAMVRRYADATNDLAGPGAGGLVRVELTAGMEAGTVDIAIHNDGTPAFPAIITPTLWRLSDGSAPFFTTGMPANEGVEALAEDGDPSVWLGALGDATAGVLMTPDGAEAAGPLMNGGTYRGTLTPTADAHVLDLASMVVPSNDTFWSTGPMGVDLYDAGGNLRDLDELNTAINEAIGAYDAGTEANQAGGMGPDMAPHQAGPDTGAAEGDGTVRPAVANGWPAPAARMVLEATIEVVE